MRVQQRSTYDDTGAYVRTIEYTDLDSEESVTYDRIVVRAPPDEDFFVVRAFDGEDLAYEQSFQMRELSFDPISAIGRGQTQKVTGTSPKDGVQSPAEIPGGVQTALNSLGMAVVPNGEWWL